MIRAMLDDATRDELHALRRTDLPAKVRDRIEMVSLSDAEWSAPRIAEHLGYHPQTVRDALRAFLARGTAALRPFRSGPAPDAERCGRVTAVLRALLARRRTWTSGQLSRALAERAGRVLANLKARAAAGLLKLYYLDECGFAPPLPTGSSWSLPGERKLVEYEAPQGRRVNALAAYRAYDRSARLDVFTAERTWTAYDLLGFLGALPWSKAPRVVVLDNAGLHTGKLVRAARAGLARRGIHLYYLPPYSPELNEIEPVFRQVKYHEMPRRSYTSRLGLREAVEEAFTGYGRQLRPKRPEYDVRPLSSARVPSRPRPTRCHRTTPRPSQRCG